MKVQRDLGAVGDLPLCLYFCTLFSVQRSFCYDARQYEEQSTKYEVQNTKNLRVIIRTFKILQEPKHAS
jgi:hypothetical protein